MTLKTIPRLKDSWKHILLLLLFTVVLLQIFKHISYIKFRFKQVSKPYYLEHFGNYFSTTYFPSVKEFTAKSRNKFNNEKARKVGFKVKFYNNSRLKNSERKLIFLATTYFHEWDPKHYYFLHLGNKTFQRYQCPISNCYVTNNPTDIKSSDALLFHVRDLEIFNIPNFRSTKQIWILYSMEPPWLEIKDLRRFDGMFNWTMSYRRSSDLLLSYGFIGKRPKATSSWKSIPLSTKQNKAIWFVSNCRTDSNREDYVRRLKKVYPVDVVGGCGSEACRPPETGKCYAKMAAKYKFYLSFENAICQDYVTEKVFNPLEYKIVPVTLGGVDYSKVLPKHSYVNAMEFKTPEDLGNHLWKISRNDSEYLSYFKWKEHYRSYLQPWMCDLCEKLHEKPVSKVKYNLDDWWHEGHSCFRWNNNSFEPIKEYAFPVYHTKIFS